MTSAPWSKPYHSTRKSQPTWGVLFGMPSKSPSGAILTVPLLPAGSPPLPPLAPPLPCEVLDPWAPELPWPLEPWSLDLSFDFPLSVEVVLSLDLASLDLASLD